MKYLSLPVRITRIAFLLLAIIPICALGDDAATKDLLTSTPWKITLQKGTTIVRNFNKDGSFSTVGKPDEGGQWRVTLNTVVQIHPGGKKDVFDLPLNPNGTTGTASDGETLTAVQVIGTGAETQTAPAAITDQQREDAKTVLVSGPWKFTGLGWGCVCTFTKDGGFAMEGEFGPGGTWAITNNMVSIAYDGRTEVLALPLNPKGTNGKDPNGRPFTAVLQNTAGGRATAGAATDTASVEAQLEAVPWRFLGTWWYAVRVLAKDGKFTTKGNGESGTWAVANNSVVLTFPDGHKDSFPLPLDPNGMHGADKEGNPVLITAGKPDPAPAAAHPHSDLDFLKQTPTPGPADIARENAGSIATLLSGPWKFTGRSWTVVRIFAKDGTFTSVNQPKEYGSWKIVGAKINLVYQDGHIDTLSLPLDPKGTDAADRVGIPVLAVLQDTSGAAPTPAPTAAPVASNPAPFGNTAPAATPAPHPQGPTPPPFGTTLPPVQ